jgi:uncharacterized membrane protein
MALDLLTRALLETSGTRWKAGGSTLGLDAVLVIVVLGCIGGGLAFSGLLWIGGRSLWAGLGAVKGLGGWFEGVLACGEWSHSCLLACSGVKRFFGSHLE